MLSSPSRSSIVGHILECHGLSLQQYRAEHPDLEVTTVRFLCRYWPELYWLRLILAPLPRQAL